jgi:hypothetical protein
MPTNNTIDAGEVGGSRWFPCKPFDAGEMSVAPNHIASAGKKVEPDSIALGFADRYEATRGGQEIGINAALIAIRALPVEANNQTKAT